MSCRKTRKHTREGLELEQKPAKRARKDALPKNGNDENMEVSETTKEDQPVTTDPEVTIAHCVQTLSSAEGSLINIQASLKSVEHSLPLHEPTAYELLQQLKGVATLLSQVDFYLHALISEHFLTCAHLESVQSCKSNLHRLLVLQNLYDEEVQYISANPAAPFLVRLILVAQPSASPMKKDSNMDPFKLVVLTGALTNIPYPQGGCTVRATVVPDPSLKGGEIELSGNETTTWGGNVIFDSLQCNSCAFLQPIRLQFSMDLTAIHGGVVSSDYSDPIIVYTNTKQWDGAQGTLLREFTFENDLVASKLDKSSAPQIVDRVPAARFYNVLQYKYLSITSQVASTTELKQETQTPTIRFMRPLTLRDFDHLMQPINKRLEIHQKISKYEFDKIWESLGRKLHVIRYTPRILQLWREGLFWGLVTRQKAADILQQFPVGTFLFRFAENTADISVAYKQAEMSVRHYLLKDNESKDIITFIRDNSGTLLQFLRLGADETERSQLSIVSVEDGFKRIDVKKSRRSKKLEEFTSEEEEYDPFIMKLIHSPNGDGSPTPH